MDHVYAECPWVVPPDAPELLALFREKGRPAFVRSRTVVNFGEEPTAYMVEEGLVGTFAGGVGKYERLIVLSLRELQWERRSRSKGSTRSSL